MGVAPRTDDDRRMKTPPAKTVLLIGTLDTKGEEYGFVREMIQARGHAVILVDAGVMGDPLVHADVPASEVARAGGGSLGDLRAGGSRAAAIDVMTAGATLVTRELYASGSIHGVLGLGGGGGTALVTAAMRDLPVGVPKLMVSTMASGNVAPYVDVKDVTMMYSVVDIAGLNPISRRVLANAAGAISGMLDQEFRAVAGQRPMIAATMFGVTTACVTAARKRLETGGFDVLIFHATGSGGRAMEGLIDDGYFAGVLDVTTTEWCDEVVGGVLSAGPDRHGAAARRGIPQVVSVGALDMVNFGAMDSVPERFRERRFHRHNASVTLMRTTPSECREIGARMASQLNRSQAPVVLLLPLRGVSMLDAPGQPFHDPAADRALFESLRENVSPAVRIREVDAHINDPVFADALADEMTALVRDSALRTADQR
jgi:uncharacterized protein (UPF0261 family)